MKLEKDYPGPCMHMIPSLLVILLTIIAVILYIRPITLSTSDAMRNTLTVSGNSDISVAPDQAIVYVSIVTEDADAKQAQQGNTVLSNAVTDALKAWGISPSDIETDAYSLSRIQEWDPEKNRYIDGNYRLTHTLKVTTTLIDRIGELVDVAVNAGANNVNNVVFSLTKETERQVRDQALSKAAEVARQKGQLLASSSGATLGKVTIIEEQSFYYTPFEYNVRMDSGAGPTAAPTQISPEKVEVTSSVKLVFELR